MSQGLHVIVGLGVTAVATARFLHERRIPFAMNDTRANPPHLAELKEAYPDVVFSLGHLDDALFDQAARLVVSPGISIKEPAIARQIARGIPVVGDIELFAEVVQAPVVAITGTNAKSTVTTLVGLMAEAAGVSVRVGGNLGVPSLDLLDPAAQLYVLELSSFQLETTFSLKSKVATILNITPDHMDRYDTVADYQAAKMRVYHNAEMAVCNRDDALTDSASHDVAHKLQFTLNQPGAREFGLLVRDGVSYLAYEQVELIPVSDLPILGRHYQANALAALALGDACGLPMAAMLNTLKTFKGLDHRCQLVRQGHGVSWYNDSKGTNVGATLAAIEGLGSEISGKLILIAGGVGKKADFSALVPVIAKYVRTLILIGEAAPILADLVGDSVAVQFADSMDAAVSLAQAVAKPGDSVLLSPACASFDMFRNFEHRGEVFTKVVQGLI